MHTNELVSTCPRCGKHYTEYPSLSRRDNKTDICEECGTLEALEDAGYSEPYTGKPYWTVTGKEEHPWQSTK